METHRFILVLLRCIFTGAIYFQKKSYPYCYGGAGQITRASVSYLSLAWATYFFVMGALNIWVAFHFSTDTWANFKLISMVGITPAFIVVQSLFLSKYMEEAE